MNLNCGLGKCFSGVLTVSLQLPQTILDVKTVLINPSCRLCGQSHSNVWLQESDGHQRGQDYLAFVLGRVFVSLRYDYIYLQGRIIVSRDRKKLELGQ